jgi:hypothetical protein
MTVASVYVSGKLRYSTGTRCVSHTPLSEQKN